MSEEKRIMDFFGITQIEGNVRGEHMGKLLMLLKMNSGKRYSYILRVSPLFLGGMQRRTIRENYLEGLLELGVIQIYSDKRNNEYYYKWIGEKALNGAESFAEPTPPQPKTKTPKQQTKEITKKLEIEEGKCPTCGKKLPKDKRFCNEECLSEYFMKKKEKK